MLTLRGPRLRVLFRLGAAAILTAAMMVAALAARTSPATAGTTATRPVAGKVPLKDLIGQPVRHVTPPAAPTQFAYKPQAPKLQAGQRSACPVPSKPDQPECEGIFRTNSPAGVKAGSVVPAATTATGYSPAQLQSAYNVTSASATGGIAGGAPVVVAITIAFDYPTAASDLAKYRANYGLIPCISTAALASQYSLPLGSGCVSKVNPDNQASPLPAAPTSSDPDFTFVASAQMDMVTAMCPNCEILLVEANYTSASMDQAIITGENDADIVLGGWYDADQPGNDQLYLNAPGKAIVFPSASSGMGTTWPASSQYVTAVGSTTLTADSSSSRGWDETAWSEGGGGCSTEPKPSWQTADDTSPGGCLNRTANDVAAVGDPDTPVAIYDSTAPLNGDGRDTDWISTGGNSAAAAIIAGIYALNGLPQAGTYPASYPYQPGVSGDFNDVTSGSDGTCESNRQYLCTAGKGYDAPTGVGTPNGAAGLSYQASGDTVAVSDPGTQDYGPGQKVSIPLQASSSDPGQAVTWTASGLPDGLSINSATGAITGTLPSSPGTSAVTATAADAGGGSDSVSFNIVTVAALNSGWSPVSGHVALNLGGKCVSDNGTTAAGGVIHIWTCETSANENWTYAPSPDPGTRGGGAIALSGATSMCIAVSGPASGSLATLQNCDGSDTQRWVLGSAGQVVNPASGLCLSDPGGSTANGTQLDLETCAGSTSQQWTLPASQILSGVPGKCLSDDGTTANGSKVWPWTCESGNANEQWILEPDGTLRIGGYCLDDTGGTTDGTLTQLYTCETGNSNQAWTIDQRGEIVNPASGKCLDDPGDSTTNGTRTVMEDCYGEPGEIWEAS